jgi:hypothetical protein
MTARRPDIYDRIGGFILLFVIALWVLHFVLPPGGPPAPV